MIDEVQMNKSIMIQILQWQSVKDLVKIFKNMLAERLYIATKYSVWATEVRWLCSPLYLSQLFSNTTFYRY